MQSLNPFHLFKEQGTETLGERYGKKRIVSIPFISSKSREQKHLPAYSFDRVYVVSIPFISSKSRELRKKFEGIQAQCRLNPFHLFKEQGTMIGKTPKDVGICLNPFHLFKEQGTKTSSSGGLPDMASVSIPFISSKSRERLSRFFKGSRSYSSQSLSSLQRAGNIALRALIGGHVAPLSQSLSSLQRAGNYYS